MRLPPKLLLSIGLAFSYAQAATPVSTPPAGKPSLHIEREQFADLGEIEILHGDNAPNDLLLLLDDAQAGAHDLALQLAQRGHWVAYLPQQHLLDNAAQHRDACLDATTLLDVFSQHVQKKYQFAKYQKPILIGNRKAAAMAYVSLAQAPNRLFAAGIGIDFCATFTQPVPPCQGNGALRWDTLAASQYRLHSLAQLATPWYQLHTELGSCTDHDTQSFGPVTTLANKELAAKIDTLLAAKIAAPIVKGSIAVDDLALVELPAPADSASTKKAAAGEDDFFVVFLSGDGGWADIDKAIGEQLNRAGIPVVGWNTLQYFWSRKTPEIASADLQRVMAHYQQSWGKSRVLLIGFSLGADVMPFMVSRLPAAQRTQIADIALLSLSHTVDFEFHVTAWLGSNKGDTHQVAPELIKIKEPILCIYGSDDDDTLCKEFKAANVANIALPGDHHYNGDVKRVTEIILEHLRKNGTR